MMDSRMEWARSRDQLVSAVRNLGFPEELGELIAKQMAATEKIVKIERKQFFGDRNLTSYIVPDAVTEIGDWAFARCRNLKWIALPRGLKKIGKKAFAECESLVAVYFYWGKAYSPTGETLSKKERLTAGLLAGAFRYFPEVQRVVSAIEAAPESIAECPTEHTPEIWLDVWDALCEQYLAQPEEVGFVPFLAGGEEDYADDGERLAAYCRQVRTVKADLVYQRLLADRLCGREGLGLAGDRKAFFRKYLRENDMAYTVLTHVTAYLQETVEVYEDAGLLGREEIGRLLDRLPQDQVELRMLLIRKCSERPFIAFLDENT